MSDAKHTRKIWKYVNKIAEARGAEPETVYLWAVKQAFPPIEYAVKEKIADEFLEHWDGKGIGFTAEKIDSDGENTTMSITKGISGFNDEETEKIIKILEGVAWKYKISLLSPDEEERYMSF